MAGRASGVNNAVPRVAGLLWIAARPPITSLTGAAYTDPARFRSSFGQISWICAAAFGSAAALAATLFTGPRRPTPTRRKPLIQTPVPHLTCPVAFPSAPEQTRPDSSQASGRSFAADGGRPLRPGPRDRHRRQGKGLVADVRPGHRRVVRQLVGRRRRIRRRGAHVAHTRPPGRTHA